MPQFDLMFRQADFVVNTDRDGEIEKVEVYVEALGSYVDVTTVAKDDDKLVAKVNEMYHESITEDRWADLDPDSER